MTNKELRIKRIRGYFIEAAQEIIDKEGIHAVTIRKVAQRAGYNSATLYNYFRNLDHLLALALSRHMGHYIETVLETLRGDETPFELYCTDWFVFAEKSFRLPKEYDYLFFKKPGADIAEVYNEYFKEHPDHFEQLPEAFRSMCKEQNQYTRDLAFLHTQFGFLEDSVLRRISEMNILLHKAMLRDLAEDEALQAHWEEYLERFKAYFLFVTRELEEVDPILP